MGSQATRARGPGRFTPERAPSLDTASKALISCRLGSGPQRARRATSDGNRDQSRAICLVEVIYYLSARRVSFWRRTAFPHSLQELTGVQPFVYFITLNPNPCTFVILGPLAGLLLASCWLLAGLLLASCWPLAGLLLASCWPLAGLLLASCWPLAGLLLALAGFLLASCWPLAGLLLASCWPLAGLLLASWPLAGLLLASCLPLAGFLLASCWPLAGLLLASCWPLAGFLLASWPLAGLLLASSWPLAGFKLPHEDFSRKSVFGKARKIGEFSS